MVALNQTNLTPKQLADQLLAEMAVIEKYHESVRELEAQVLAYEQKYGMPTSEVHDAIEDGRLVETEEVCDWILDSEMLERVK
jgi:predicted transcriptional regulator